MSADDVEVLRGLLLAIYALIALAMTLACGFDAFSVGNGPAGRRERVKSARLALASPLWPLLLAWATGRSLWRLVRLAVDR